MGNTTSACCERPAPLADPCDVLVPQVSSSSSGAVSLSSANNATVLELPKAPRDLLPWEHASPWSSGSPCEGRTEELSTPTRNETDFQTTELARGATELVPRHPQNLKGLDLVEQANEAGPEECTEKTCKANSDTVNKQCPSDDGDFFDEFSELWELPQETREPWCDNAREGSIRSYCTSSDGEDSPREHDRIGRRREREVNKDAGDIGSSGVAMIRSEASMGVRGQFETGTRLCSSYGKDGSGMVQGAISSCSSYGSLSIDSYSSHDPGEDREDEEQGEGQGQGQGEKMQDENAAWEHAHMQAAWMGWKRFAEG